MVEGALAVTLLYLMVANYEIGIMVVGVVFLSSYLFAVAYAILREAAREMAQKPTVIGPMRERLKDIKDEWQRAVSAPETAYLPAPTGPHSYSSISPQTDPFAALARQDNAPLPGMMPTTAPNVPPPAASPVNAPLRPSSISARKETITYGIEPFLSDNLNPIFAKDMRSGLFGKAHYFFRFAYGATILTEVLVMFLMAMDSLPRSLFDFTNLLGAGASGFAFSSRRLFRRAQLGARTRTANFAATFNNSVAARRRLSAAKLWR